MAKKYPGLKEDDTKFDEYHKANGLMTNREFFTSNAPGGFYEGMKWDEESQEWVLNDYEQSKVDARYEANKCSDCGGQKPYCECY